MNVKALLTVEVGVLFFMGQIYKRALFAVKLPIFDKNKF